MNDFEIARVLKPHLKFNVGELVYLKSDRERTFPFVVLSIFTIDENWDYKIARPPANRKNDVECLYVNDKCLIGEKEKENENIKI